MKPSTKNLTIKDAILENTLTEEAKNGLNKIKEPEKTVERANLVYKTNDYTYIFKSFRTINTFSSDIYNGKTTFKESNEYQSNLLVEIMDIKKKKRPQNPEKNPEKGILKNSEALFECRERVPDVFESKIFPIKIEGAGFSNKVSEHSNLKILTPKQMLQRLPIALTQVEAVNTSRKFT